MNQWVTACLLAATLLSQWAFAADPTTVPTTVPTTEPAIIRIDPSTNWGTWDGWGVSLCWWANVFGNRDDLADAVFTLKNVNVEGETLPGLGLNIARYNAGACSPSQVGDRKIVISQGMRPYRQMDGFWLDGKNPDPHSSSWNWNADTNQRAMLIKARNRGANLFELFSNSPMWWMCANDNPSGAARGSDDNLAPVHDRDFAIYLATIAAQAKAKWGITFNTIEPFNESSSHFWSATGHQEGCHFSFATQAKILPLLRAAMDERGLKTMGIAASDENTYDEGLTTWRSFNPDIRKLIDRVNVHGYQGSHGNRAGLYAAIDGKKLWNSEYGENDYDGLRLAHNIDIDLHTLHPTAWVYWQILDGGGWGLINADVPHARIQQAESKYFVLAQYTRHIRPGMIILGTGGTNSVAAYDAKTHRLVIVTTNQGKTPRDATFDLSGFASASDGPVTRYLTEPQGESRYARQPDAQLRKKQLKMTLPPMCVETFEVSRVDR